MKKVKIRFNTQNTGKLFWRVIIDGKEQLADKIKMKCYSETTQDELPTGEIKFHITAYAEDISWSGTTLILR